MCLPNNWLILISFANVMKSNQLHTMNVFCAVFRCVWKMAEKERQSERAAAMATNVYKVYQHTYRRVMFGSFIYPAHT